MYVYSEFYTTLLSSKINHQWATLSSQAANILNFHAGIAESEGGIMELS
jgi:hypothetical protein